MIKNNIIVLIVPSLKAGGMERVMAEIANQLSLDSNLEIHLILFSQIENFYTLNKNIKCHRPGKPYNSSFSSIFKLLGYLRNKLKILKPDAVLSFGSMYNSFVLLSSLGLKLNIFVSDRSNPFRNTYLSLKKNKTERHDGILHYILKQILYRKAKGILVQTELAKKIEERTLKHKNIVHIPNPIKSILNDIQIKGKKENIILNVGRFIKTKQQKLLVDIFDSIQFDDWKLVFLGDGPEFEVVRDYARSKKSKGLIFFKGNVSDVDSYYAKSKIFSFTSISEGFPNALGEALMYGIPSISFDCIAGPNELINNNKNGYLIPINEIDMYRSKLIALMKDETLRNKFSINAISYMEKYKSENIVNKIKSTLLESQK